MSKQVYVPGMVPINVEDLPEYLGRELPRLSREIDFQPKIFDWREISATTIGVVVLDDTDGGIIRMNHTATNSLVISLQATVPWPPGCQISAAQWGTGETQISASAGVTIRTPETQILEKQYAAVTIINVGKDEWLLAGQLVAG